MDGVLVIDKPAGLTSHDVVARVRKAAGQKKVGHAGTLDPQATGVLVVALGRATRLVPYLQASRKTYEAHMRLGVSTTTLDAEGEVVATADPSGVTEEAFCEVLHGFTGRIEQVPPMVSAVKVGGERLHEKARRGETVAREAREVDIHELVLSEFVPGAEAQAWFLVTCSPGTYIRSLAADVGEALGVGAHLAALRRLGSGRFDVADARPLEEIEELGQQGRVAEAVLSMASAVADYPAITVDAGDAQAIGHGRPLSATAQDGPVAVLDEDGRLLAMVEDERGAARPRAVFAG
ncbi:tRNA pseudouridine(55) synthase TruB [Egibacter rhizosphaerae]|uniref:tRNA pseudouridine synthase B n=1 Tax=Egibacter rhizosphaerae TaxID=1670831 RepID=A0A411YL54_9ACTN|nr:tRNA pseudouridine(55) synthase TruB [Egibacter rhizosphaerae]